MVRPAIQLYTLRELDESMTATLGRVAETAYEGVEFAGLGDETAETVAAALHNTDLVPVGAHVGLDTLEEEYEATVEMYRTLGCDRIVIPSYGADGFTSPSAVSEAATQLSAVTDRLAADGFEAHYHNHAYEFSDIEGDFDTAYDALAAWTDDRLKLEFDVGLACHGDVDPLRYLDRYAKRISLIHLTDTVPGSEETLHVDLDEGVVDLSACVRRATDAEWLIHEHGLTTDPKATLAKSAMRVQELLGGT